MLRDHRAIARVLFGEHLATGPPTTNVNTCLEQKPQRAVLVSVGPDDTVESALRLMRHKRVRAVLVLEAGSLAGIASTSALPSWGEISRVIASGD